MSEDWTGYRGDWRFADWENEVLTINSLPATGHTQTALATNVRAKADGEKNGMAPTDMGTVTIGYTRRFFFAAAYIDADGNTKDPRSDAGNDLLEEGNVIIDADGRNWSIMGAPNPGGADEHFEVQTTRRPT